MPDPTLHTAALAALEVAANRALALSEQGTAVLEPLTGSVFAFHCTTPELDFYLHLETGGVRLTGVYEGAVTARITGSASDFSELAASEDAAATLINGNLTLEGNSAPLIEFQHILSDLDIDWEAPLVSSLGDVAGHQIAEILRSAFSWGRQASSGLARQVEEFIHEEARLSPPKLEVEDFFRDIADLVMRVDRLQSRVERISRKLKKS